MSPWAMIAHAGGALALTVAVLGPALILWLTVRGWPLSLRSLAALALALFFVFLALHPFPDPARLDCGSDGTGVPARLVPFGFVDRAVALWRDGASAADWFGDRIVATAAFNFWLFAGLGWLIAGGHRPLLRPASAVLAGFALSLGVETAQASGLFGLYPCAWRQFDVDDLILNTAGMALAGLIGARQTDRVTR